MKVALHILILCFLLPSQALLANKIPFSNYSSIDTLVKNNSESFVLSDSITNKDHNWPECPEVLEAKLMILDSKTFLLHWNTFLSPRIEYSVEIVDQGEIVQKEINNSGVYIFQLDPDWSLQSLQINLESLCYFENRLEPIKSDGLRISWDELIKSSEYFCESYDELIFREQLDSFDILSTKFPKNVNLTFDICNDNDCQDYNHAVENSAIPEKNDKKYSYDNPKLFTKFGNFDCISSRFSVTDPCDALVVEELDSCVYAVTYPDTLAPACTMALLSHQITHSLCGHQTGRIFVRPTNGNEPYYYKWSTGDEGYENNIDDLLSGSYTVTVTDITGCEIITTIDLLEKNSVRIYTHGGDDGLQEMFELTPGMDINWRFTPYTITDQLMITGESLLVNTGPITSASSTQCQTDPRCSCSDVYISDSYEGEELPIPTGIAVRSGGYAEGDIVVPSSGLLDLNVIGAICDSGTGWALYLECNSQNKSTNNEEWDISYISYPKEVEGLISGRQITKSRYLKDSIAFYKIVETISTGIKSAEYKDVEFYQARNGGNNTIILDFQCSNHVASPYNINMINEETGEIFSCPIIDQLDCTDCGEEEEGVLCEYFQIDIDSLSYYPNWQISWTSINILDLEIEMIINGQLNYISSEQSGTELVSPGDQITIQVALASENTSSNCTFNIDVPVEIPDNPIREEVLCSYFNLLQGEELNSNELILTIAGGDESLINTVLQQSGSEMAELEGFLSQIASIELTLETNSVGSTSGNMFSKILYSNPNGNIYNGEFSLYFDPIDWAKTIDLDTDSLEAQFTITITDIDGNVYDCGENQLPIVFPEDEEEEEDDGDFGLECEDEPNTTILTSTLYDGDIEGKILTFKGFPFIVDDASPSSGGIYSGSGFIAVPFGENTKLSISFPSLTVNDSLQVIDGQIFVSSNSPGNYPVFNLPSVPINIGGDICIETTPPSGYTEDGFNNETDMNNYGFRKDSTHVLTNSIWDPNGFNFNGIHKDTETEFNEDGCNRDGIDINNNPCDPSGDDEFLNKFIDSVQTSLPLVIDTLVKDIVQEIIDSLNTLNCAQYRTIVNQKIGQLNFSREFIVGQDEEYIDEGLSDHFASEPKKLVTSVAGRNEDVVLLEENHVELYKCDKEEKNLTELRAVLQGICNDPDNTEFIDHLNLLMQNWGSFEKELYLDDPSAFREWIEYSINEYIENTIKPKHGIAYSEKPINILDNLNSIFDFNNAMGYMGSAVASTEHVHFESDLMADIDFDYLQGMEYINGVHRMYFVEQLAKINASINGGSVLELPIIIPRQVGSFVYSIYIDNILFDFEEGITLDAYFILEDPGSGRRIGFAALSVPFNAGGLTTNTRLEMIGSDVELRLNNATMMILKATPQTYVEWNCHGFESMGVDLGFDFCRNFIIPTDASGVPEDDTTRYRLDVQLNVDEWLEFDLEVNSPSPFVLAKYEDIVFDFKDILIDLNSKGGAAISPIGDYQSEYLENGTLTPEWKGFHIGSLSVTLPNKFGSGNLKILASDIIIDGTGVTGQTEVTTEELVSIEEGNLSGWPFSVNKFGLIFVQNHVAGGVMGGLVNVPIFQENMEYSAMIFPGDKYQFNVTPLTDASVDILLGKVTLESTSSISITHEDGSFNAKAILNGNLQITGESEEGGQEDVNGATFTFSNLTISNVAEPSYFTPGTWKLDGDIDMSFKGFDLRVNGDRCGMFETGNVSESEFIVDIGIVLNNSIKVSAEGAFGLVGELEVINERQKWRFKEINPRKVIIDGSFPGVEHLHAELNWYKDNTYGDGFRGAGQAIFKGFNADIAAIAQFGKMEGYKYFFVDASVNANLGIGIGPFSISGFTGGLSYNMSSDFDPANINFSSPSSVPTGIGQSFSGITYTPDDLIGLGIRAGMQFSLLGEEQLFNGSLLCKMDFYESGGLAEASLIGIGQLMKIAENLPVSDVPESKTTGLNSKPQVDAPLAGYVYFNFEPGRSFHGEIGIYLDAGPLYGGGQNKQFVMGELHFSPENWYVKIGNYDMDKESSSPNAVLDILGIAKVNIGAYFWAGSNVPTLPDPPAKVKEIAYKYKNALRGLRPGAGVILGAGFTAEFTVGAEGIADVSVEAGAGFDVMLRKFTNVTCDGNSVGMNGWYAAGQLWAYLQAKLKLFGVSLLEAGVAAVLQARLPNPTAITGVVGVQAKLVFFTIKKSLRVTLGNDCDLVAENPIDAIGMEVISHMDPVENSTEVSTDFIPKVYLNIPVNKYLDLKDINGNTNRFRLTLPDTAAIIISGQDTIPTEIRIAEDGKELFIYPDYVFHANDTVTVEFNVNVYLNNELISQEHKSTTFTTAGQINHIPDTNVLASYPFDGMANFHSLEYSVGHGFIDLELGQPALLQLIPEGMKQVMRLTALDTGVETEINYDYNPGINRISFPLDPNIITPDTKYKLELVRIPVSEQNGGENTETGTHSESLTIASIFFRSSIYQTFEEKLDAIKSAGTTSELVGITTKLYYDLEDIEFISEEEGVKFVYSDAISSSFYRTNYADLYTLFPSSNRYHCIGGGFYPFDNNEHLIESTEIVTRKKLSVDFGNEANITPLYSPGAKLEFNYASQLQSDLSLAYKSVQSCKDYLETEVCSGIGTDENGHAIFAADEDGWSDDSEENMEECLNDRLGAEYIHFLNNAGFVDIEDGTFRVYISYSLQDGTKTTETYIDFIK